MNYANVHEEDIVQDETWSNFDHSRACCTDELPHCAAAKLNFQSQCSEVIPTY